MTGEVVLHQYRPDEPRCDASGKVVKYETPRRASLTIDAHPTLRTRLGDPSVPLFWTEGIRKGDSAVSHGLCCVALLGVYGFRGTNALGGKVALPELQAIAHNGRQEYLVFDSDVMLKPTVHEALRQFKALLEHCGARVAVIYLPSGPGGTKVGLDDYLAAGHSVDDLLRLASPSLLPPVVVSLNVDREPSHEQAPDPDLPACELEAAALREAEDPLTVIEQAIRAQGYGGDVRPAVLVHIALSTRLLRMRPGGMPAHVLLLGQPSSGKNHALHVNLRLLPAAAYHVIDAGSPRVLIYDDADLRHRAVIFGEADSLPAGEDNPAASAIRNLLQDHHLHYKVTERDPESGGFRVRTIAKPGPTILVTTATRRLGEQLDTRLFAVEVPDDQRQLRQALQTQAALELHGVPEPDPAVVAYQGLLQRRVPWDVHVPFVASISTALGRGPVAARVLRDFNKILALVKAVVVLRHSHRARDSRGRLIAEVKDYRTVFDLVHDAYTASTTGAGIGVRTVVEAVAALRSEGTEPVTALHVAKRLAVNKSTASRHVRAALEGGWLVNLSERRGRYDLDAGDPLPQDGLPTPEEVEQAYLSVTPAIMQPLPQDLRKTASGDGCATVAPSCGGTGPATGPTTAETQAGGGVPVVGSMVAAVTERDDGRPVEGRPTNGNRRAVGDVEGARIWLRTMHPERAAWIERASSEEVKAAVQALEEDAPV